MKSPLIIVLFFTFFTAILSLSTTQSLASWEGFDQDNNADIEIPSGNLVREGLVIEFYENEELHMGRVTTVDSVAGGTEVTVEDFNDHDRQRTFIMR